MIYHWIPSPPETLEERQPHERVCSITKYFNGWDFNNSSIGQIQLVENVFNRCKTWDSLTKEELIVPKILRELKAIELASSIESEFGVEVSMKNCPIVCDSYGAKYSLESICMGLMRKA